jgi:hypothetical protein
MSAASGPIEALQQVEKEKQTYHDGNQGLGARPCTRSTGPDHAETSQNALATSKRRYERRVMTEGMSAVDSGSFVSSDACKREES